MTLSQHVRVYLCTQTDSGSTGGVGAGLLGTDKGEGFAAFLFQQVTIL